VHFASGMSWANSRLMLLFRRFPGQNRANYSRIGFALEARMSWILLLWMIDITIIIKQMQSRSTSEFLSFPGDDNF
jgi:hypothetical protein